MIEDICVIMSHVLRKNWWNFAKVIIGFRFWQFLTKAGGDGYTKRPDHLPGNNWQPGQNETERKERNVTGQHVDASRFAQLAENSSIGGDGDHKRQNDERTSDNQPKGAFRAQIRVANRNSCFVPVPNQNKPFFVPVIFGLQPWHKYIREPQESELQSHEISSRLIIFWHWSRSNEIHAKRHKALLSGPTGTMPVKFAIGTVRRVVTTIIPRAMRLNATSEWTCWIVQKRIRALRIG